MRIAHILLANFPHQFTWSKVILFAEPRGRARWFFRIWSLTVDMQHLKRFFPIIIIKRREVWWLLLAELLRRLKTSKLLRQSRKRLSSIRHICFIRITNIIIPPILRYKIIFRHKIHRNQYNHLHKKGRIKHHHQRRVLLIINDIGTPPARPVHLPSITRTRHFLLIII